MPFDGATYDQGKDFERLTSQLERVRYLLTHPKARWWTLQGLQEKAGGSESAISARVRDLRKPKFGGLNVEAVRMGSKTGLGMYRVPVAG